MRNITSQVLFLFMVLSSSLCALNSDEWLGENITNNSLDIRYSFEGSEESTRALGLNLLGPMYSEFLFYYTDITTLTLSSRNSSQNSLQDSSQKSLNLQSRSMAWTSDPLARFSLSLAYHNSGKKNSLEVSDYDLGAVLMQGDWRFGLSYLDGKVKGYSRDRLVGMALASQSATIKRSGYGATLQFMQNSWSIGVNGRHYNYNRDLSRALTSRRFLLAFDDVLISQVLMLNNWSAGINAAWYWERWIVDLGTQFYESVVNEESLWQQSLGSTYSLSTSVDLQAHLYFAQDDSAIAAEFGATFRW